MATRRSFLQLIGFAPLGYRFIVHNPPTNMLTFFVGTYTNGDSEGIYRCRMNAETGALEMVKATGGIANPSFLALSPDRSFLYAVGETTEFGNAPGGGVYAFEVDPETYALTALNAQPTRGGAPCYVSVTPDGKHVLVANYLGGNVSIYPVRADGRLGDASDLEQHEGSSIDERRQAAPHAHCILADPAGAYAFAVDLGIDKVVIYRLESSDLVPAGHASLKPGAGPRHIAFHPSGERAYVINELDSTVTAFTYSDGALEPMQTISTLPDDFQGESYCADIHVSTDGRFVYGSNRGHDSIVVFAIAPDTGRLTTKEHVPTGGAWPRNFAIDPSGRFLLAANQHTDDIFAFEIDPGSGRLAATDHSLAIPSPVCLKFV